MGLEHIIHRYFLIFSEINDEKKPSLRLELPVSPKEWLFPLFLTVRAVLDSSEQLFTDL